MKPAVLALSETRLIEDIEDSEINMPGYSVVRCDAENRNTGGVMLYIRDNIRYEIVLNQKIISNCWCIAVEIKDSVHRVIAVVYHSPSASDGEFIRFLEDIVELLETKGQCIMIGDFNIDLKSESFYAKKLITEMACLGMKQYVDKPTRITKNSKTLIDLVFSNKRVNCRVFDRPKITDHSWISVEIKCIDDEHDKYREFITRDFNKYHVVELCKVIKDSLKDTDDLEVNVRADKLIQSIVEALNIVAPKKKVRIPKIWEGKKWYTDDIRVATKKRDEAYNKAMRTSNEQDWLQFKTVRNAVVTLIRRKKKEYYEDMIDNNSNDPARMWKTVKKLINGEGTGTREINTVDFEILENVGEYSLADKFNLYYIQSIEEIIESIGGNYNNGNRKKSNYDIENRGVIEEFAEIDVCTLERIIRNLPSKKGTDEGITGDILRDSFHVIKEEFVRLINISLSTGMFPERWKTSTVIPIPKVGKPMKASEYRPINMLPTYEKVLELVVKEQIEKYLQDNNVITESCFRRKHSCETAIQTVIDDWKLIVSEGEIVGIIFLDLKRAFETVDRDRLLEKIWQYGIRGRVVEWLKAYLNNRMQQVRLNNQWSKKMKTKHGVPQGSVLGPLLFTIYINDMVEICPEGCKIKMFADDTLIYVKGGGSVEIESKLNAVLPIVEKWLNINKLKMNANKTKFMIIKSVRKELKRNITVKCLDGTMIERVENIKYLGVVIDSGLRFEGHCDYVLKKIGKKVSFLNRIGNDITGYARCTVYKTIIAPHFEYCATLLMAMGEMQLTKLQRAQNRAMRVILQCDRYTRVETMLQTLRFMSVRQRMRYNVCVFIFKIVKGMMPEHLRERITLVGETNVKQTRQSENIVIQFRRTRNAQKSLYYEGVKMYNDMPTELKLCDRLAIFKRRLKEYIFTLHSM